jgi:LuxR family transcriptional regulator, maltose regulon positive regulatory protein
LTTRASWRPVRDGQPDTGRAGDGKPENGRSGNGEPEAGLPQSRLPQSRLPQPEPLPTGSVQPGSLPAGSPDSALLEAKLRIPRAEVDVLPRLRVRELIDKAVGHRVTLMTGPPGAGKTVAAAEWVTGESPAARRGGCRPAWVSLDRADREPAGFWRNVMTALAGAAAPLPGGTAPPSGSTTRLSGATAPQSSTTTRLSGATAPPSGATAPRMQAGKEAAAAAAGGRTRNPSAGNGQNTHVEPVAGIEPAADLGEQDPGVVGEALRWISSVLRSAAQPILLILDDVQVLAGSKTLTGLDELIQRQPPGLRLLLIGRHAPGLALARLRLAGELADISSADLACTSDETAAYFAMMGIPLSPAERTRVLEQTEGWLAGLRLTALAAEAGSPVPGGRPTAGKSASGELALGTGTLVADYLHDEVLGQLPDRVRSFLLRTCLTATVSADLARDLTGEVGSARLLEQLGRETSLIEPVTSSSPSAAAEYRYHPMLRNVLAADLRRELPDDVAALYGRVARWHAGRGQVLAAVQAAAAVGDWQFGLQLLRDAGPAVMLSAAAPGMEAALASLQPAQLSGDMTVAVALAAGRLWQGDPDGALPHLEAAQSGLGSVPEPDRGHAELWVAALGVLHGTALGRARPGELERERQEAGRASANPRGAAEHQAAGILWLALGLAALSEFDTRRARSALLHAGSQLAAGGLFALRERSRAWEAVACALDGDLAAATRLADGVADGPQRQDEDLAPVLALAGATVSLARDEPDGAALLLDQAELGGSKPRLAGEPSIAIICGLLRARLAVADGNLAGARGLVRWLTDTAAAEGQSGYAPERSGGGAAAEAVVPGDGAARARRTGTATVIEVMDAEISLAAGERERARATLAELTARPSGELTARPSGELTAQPPGEPAAPAADRDSALPRPDAVVCGARLLIADSEEKEALRLLEPLLADGTGAWSVADRIAALLAALVAHRRLGQSAEAAELLSAALALAEPDDAYSPFLAAGPPVRSALTALISPSSRFASFAGRILDRFDGRQARHFGAQPPALLTDSELAVLRFLPSHMTNQEIAEALFLSINTIKTHLSSVYRKLGVANRRQAIAQGRRLELLLETCRETRCRDRAELPGPGFSWLLASARWWLAAPSVHLCGRARGHFWMPGSGRTRWPTGPGRRTSARLRPA